MQAAPASNSNASVGAVGDPFIAGLASRLEHLVVHLARLLRQYNPGSHHDDRNNRQRQFPVTTHSGHPACPPASNRYFNLSELHIYSRRIPLAITKER